MDVVELLLDLQAHERVTDRFRDLPGQTRRRRHIRHIHERGVVHGLDGDAAQETSNHAVADLVDLRVGLPVDPRWIEVWIVEQLAVVDHARRQTAALQQDILSLEKLLVRGLDPEEVVDRDQVLVLTLDLDLDPGAVERCRKVAGQECSQHHDDDDRQGHLPPLVDDVPVVGKMDFLADLLHRRTGFSG